MNERKILIYAVGDIMLGEQALCYGFGVKTIIKNKGIGYIFKDVNETFKNGDIVFGNLEAPVSDYTTRKGIDAKIFRADIYSIEGLKNSYFNVLSVANNHIMEHGKEAFFSTINLLKKYNITAVGILNEKEILEIKGLKIGFIAYSLIDDFIEDPLYNRIYSDKKILDDIRDFKKDVDVLIVSLHWGDEYIYNPSKEQILLGRNILDCGADILLGSHPHVIQGYEIYKGKPIIYSLGNFIFDHSYISRTRNSVIAKLFVDIDNKDIDISMIPITLNYKEYYPKIAVNKDKYEVLEIIKSIQDKIQNNGNASYPEDRYKKYVYIEMKMQFIKNLYRYPLSLSIKIAKDYIQKLIKIRI